MTGLSSLGQYSSGISLQFKKQRGKKGMYLLEGLHRVTCSLMFLSKCGSESFYRVEEKNYLLQQKYKGKKGFVQCSLPQPWL